MKKKTTKKNKYVCKECGSKLVVVTYYKMADDCMIDPKTGLEMGETFNETVLDNISKEVLCSKDDEHITGWPTDWNNFK